MKITFYSNCILNSEYSEVFYDANTLLNYLDTLTSREIEVNDTYITLEGNLVVSNVTLLHTFNYNYLKIESDKGTIFAFIRDIQTVNECAIVSYRTDIWSTYFDKWSLRKSLLSRTIYPALYECEFAKLPIDYVSQGGLLYNKIVSDDCNLIVGLRFYTLDSAGKTTDQYYAKFLVAGSIVSRDTPYQGLSKKNKSAADCFKDIKYIIRAQTSFDLNYINGNGTSTERIDYNFEIDDFVIIPSDFQATVIFDYGSVTGTDTLSYNYYSIRVNTDDNDALLILPMSNPVSTALVTSGNKKAMLNSPYRETSVSLSIPNDATIVGVGTRTNMVEIPFYYNEQYVNISIRGNNEGFVIILNINGKDNDVTSLYTIEYPYNTILSQENQLRQINRTQKNIQAGFNIASGVVSLATNAISFGGTAMGNYWMSQGNFNYVPYQSTGLKALQTAQPATNSIGTIANGITDLVKNNAKVYETGYKSDTIPNGIVNAYYGLGYFSLDWILNSVQVQDAITETGYEVKKIVNSIANINSDAKYDVIKFDFVRIKGCTEVINNAIEKILLDGTKIWYTSDVSE